MYNYIPFLRKIYHKINIYIYYYIYRYRACVRT